MNLCKQCNEPLTNRRNKFCNSSCAAIYNNTGRVKVEKVISKCLSCNKDYTVKKNSKGMFCSVQCSRDYDYKEYIRLWKDNLVDGSKSGGNAVSSYVRRYLFEKYKNKCPECGWGKRNPSNDRVMLEIHHIDGNSTDSSEKNLILLCPNCHSLTNNYGFLNKGNGSQKRLDYYKLR